MNTQHRILPHRLHQFAAFYQGLQVQLHLAARTGQHIAYEIAASGVDPVRLEAVNMLVRIVQHRPGVAEPQYIVRCRRSSTTYAKQICCFGTSLIKN